VLSKQVNPTRSVEPSTLLICVSYIATPEEFAQAYHRQESGTKIPTTVHKVAAMLGSDEEEEYEENEEPLQDILDF